MVRPRRCYTAVVSNATDDAGPAGQRLLRLHAVTLYVRDRARSVRFFVDALGFSQVSGGGGAGEPAWVAVAPPDGSALVSLVEMWDGSPLPPAPAIVFLTDDVHARHAEWTRRGVRFPRAPIAGAWGAYAVFEDPDGNAMTLATVDPLTRELDAARRTAAERAERERQAAFELRLAADVQARLFPQTAPPAATLDYAGTCRQARRVGGDYYDFLDLGGGRLVLVLADVSGKGMPAALLMASLQAHVRGAGLTAGGDPARVLEAVNQRCWDAWPSSAYASLIYAEYDAGTRRLRYVNCGHPPLLLVRRDGGIERLAATTTVLGLFEACPCPTAETPLEPGDRLLLYSDGVTEALDAGGVEFGEERLIATLRAADATAPASALVDRVCAAVLAHGGGEQYDDVTVIAAVAR
jgi:serine phosphatase RsbU (regulator of sigma subunit)/predicted enzyme related to lactoylglutathione lyase